MSKDLVSSLISMLREEAMHRFEALQRFSDCFVKCQIQWQIPRVANEGCGNQNRLQPSQEGTHYDIRASDLRAQETRHFDGKCARRGMASCHIAVVSPSNTVERMCAAAFASSRCLRKTPVRTARFSAIPESSADGVFIRGVATFCYK